MPRTKHFSIEAGRGWYVFTDKYVVRMLDKEGRQLRATELRFGERSAVAVEDEVVTVEIYRHAYNWDAANLARLAVESIPEGALLRFKTRYMPFLMGHLTMTAS